MQEIVLFSTLREKSTRCPGKLIRAFNKTYYSVADVFAYKFDQLVKTGKFQDSMLAIHKNDVALRSIFKDQNVVDRSDDSIIGAPPLNTIFECLKNTKCKYAMWVNPCLMFMPMSKYLDAVDTFRDFNMFSATAVVERRSWFFDSRGFMVNKEDQDIVDTQRRPPVLECCHAFHIFEVERMLKTGTYWSGENYDPVPLIINATQEQLMDVDTEFDWKLLDSHVTANNITFEAAKERLLAP